MVRYSQVHAGYCNKFNYCNRKVWAIIISIIMVIQGKQGLGELLGWVKDSACFYTCPRKCSGRKDYRNLHEMLTTTFVNVLFYDKFMKYLGDGIFHAK